jgi:hypothetical protein
MFIVCGEHNSYSIYLYSSNIIKNSTIKGNKQTLLLEMQRNFSIIMNFMGFLNNSKEDRYLKPLITKEIIKMRKCLDNLSSQLKEEQKTFKE